MRPLSNLNLALNRATIGNGNGEFSPSDLSSISAWWDPDDGDTVTYSSPEVSSVMDKAGDADLVNPVVVGVNLPDLASSGGRNWLSFAASNSEALRVADPADSGILFGADEFTIAAVYQTSSTSQICLLNKGANVSGRYRVRLNQSTAGDYLAQIHDGSTGFPLIIGSGSNDGDPHVLVMLRDNSANLLRLRIDGTEVGTLDITGCGNIDETSGADLTAQLLIGANPVAASAGNYWDGLIGEIVMCQDQLEGTDLTDLESYLIEKWGVS